MGKENKWNKGTIKEILSEPVIKLFSVIIDKIREIKDPFYVILIILFNIFYLSSR